MLSHDQSNLVCPFRGGGIILVATTSGLHPLICLHFSMVRFIEMHGACHSYTGSFYLKGWLLLGNPGCIIWESSAGAGPAAFPKAWLGKTAEVLIDHSLAQIQKQSF